ncbi:MAG: pseudouridine synthase [Patescibacteria group bacterium]
MNDADKTRLNKLLALRLGVSRREADDLIDAGKVTIDGQTATLGARTLETAVIEVGGQPLVASPSFRYVAFHKPAGYVCSRKSQGENPTIYDLLPQDMHVLKPVGRLDKDSSGLILLTNDGDFAHSMTHPKFSKVKVYDVSLDAPLAPLHQQMIADYGIEIGDGTSKLSLERRGDDRTNWIVTMNEGRNRQIRRTFASLGYAVTSLHRKSFGTFNIGELASGETRAVSP